MIDAIGDFKELAFKLDSFILTEKVGPVDESQLPSDVTPQEVKA